MTNSNLNQPKKTNPDWRKVLTPQQFAVTREKATECPFTGEYYNFDKVGIYKCVCCGNKLFGSEAKFDSGTGWPSFFAPASPKNIIEKPDESLGLQRTEVLCSSCDAHLGHVFNDGPKPTYLHYCINSAALMFEDKETK